MSTGKDEKKTQHSADDIFAAAEEFYNKKDKEGLEKLFGSFLKYSYDYRLWKLYLSYTKSLSLNNKQILDVFVFILNHFEHGYYNYDFITQYIEELDKSTQSDSVKAETIRKAYQQFLRQPMDKLPQLWSTYESWEISINRMSARSILEQFQPFYLNALNVFQKIGGAAKRNNYYACLDVEIENPLKLNKKLLDQRLLFIMKYFSSFGKEPLEILKTIYVPTAYDFTKDKDAIAALCKQSRLLSFWFSFYFKQDLFNLDDSPLFNLTAVNYLIYYVQNSGLEEFREKFEQLKKAFPEKLTPHVWIYAAETELLTANDPTKAYEIMMEAHEKFGNDPILNEKFLDLLIKHNEPEKIKILFKKLSKTDKMYHIMMDYEFRRGSFSNYKELLLEKQDAIKNREILEGGIPVRQRANFAGTQGVFSTAAATFEYLDLSFTSKGVSKAILTKIPDLPEEENIFRNIDLDRLIKLIERAE